MTANSLHENDDLDDDDLDIEDEQRLVTLLEKFEVDVRQGREPQIESYLTQVGSKLRPHLRADLRRIENELCDDSAHTVRAVVPLYAAERDQVQVTLPTATQPSLLAETAELLRVTLMRSRRAIV